ncbi:MAG: hypothetical protein A2506_11610, partial [Elusimicrobia bacterium RIFOXYD12_FULL_66_9]
MAIDYKDYDAQLGEKRDAPVDEKPGAPGVMILALLLFAAFAGPAQAGAREATVPQRLSDRGELELLGILAEGRLNHLQFSEYQSEIEDFYRTAGYTLAWVHKSRPTAKARAVIKLLRAAEKQGLLPDEYDGPLWKKRLADLRRPHRRASESRLLRFDLMLTVCAMHYILDLRLGRINPQRPRSPLDVHPHIRRLWDLTRERIAPAPDVAAALSAVEPPFPAYRRLVKAVQRYNRLARQDDGEKLPASVLPVAPGDRYAGMPRLARLLALLGDLPPGAATDPELYTKPLVKAVMRFQRRHGIAPSGLLDEQTLQQLNTPLTLRLRQLRLTLERWRWLPHEFARPPIIVNIPEFSLYAGDARPQKVVVGMAFEHETPVFSSMLTEVIFRPPWNVPMSIQRDELVAKIAKNPATYLEKNDFDVLDAQGNIVASEAVSPEVLNRLEQGRLYMRQRPGAYSALGLVKFMMPNTGSVYLHGTPSKRGFLESRRDLSH